MARVVVAGAGSAGSAAAGRLAEAGHEVVLIDAGPDWWSESCPDEIRHPPDDVFAWRVDGRSPSRYAFPDVSARRFPEGSAEPYLRGWGMGGTSSINGLVVVRPPEDEWDHWVELGCTGWGPADVLPAFRRLEDDVDYGDEPYHGRGGPTPVVRRREDEWGDGDRLLADQAFDAGHAWEPDYHRPGAAGVSRTASNIRLGVRVTAYDGYVDPWRTRGRIQVVADTVVDRVRVDASRATGVRVLTRDGESAVIDADHVVLSAGAAATPGILQRSGIAPSAHSRERGIKPIADLPVGAGIQDHVGFWLSVDLPGAQPAANGARGNAMLRYSSNLPDARESDLLVVAANPAPTGADEVAFGVKLGHCLSRGSSRIVSRDPRDAADIALRLLSDPADAALAREAVRSAARILGAGGRCVRDRFGREVAPSDDREIDGWLRANARDTSHLSGGCRMGDPASELTVVDPTLAVLGVGSLTVADMSVAPIVPRANPHLTAIMIGERAATFVDTALAASARGQARTAPPASESRMPRSASST